MRCCTASSTTSRLKDQHNSALTSWPPPAGPPIRRKPKSAHEARPPRAMRDTSSRTLRFAILRMSSPREGSEPAASSLVDVP